MRGTPAIPCVVLTLAGLAGVTAGCSRIEGKEAGYQDESLPAQVDAGKPEVATGAPTVSGAAEGELPDPERPLKADEAEALVEQVVVLLDRDLPFDHHRDVALAKLGLEIRHRAALPAFRRVLWDEDENENDRANVLRHMVALGVPEALDDAIKLLRHPIGRLRGLAWLILRQQYPAGDEFRFEPTKSGDANATAIKRWEDWWKQNRATFKVKFIDPRAPESGGFR
jgi:hypothetical protein